MSSETDARVASQGTGLSKTAVCSIVAGFIVLAAAIGLTVYVLSSQEAKRAEDLEGRIGNAEVRLDSLTSALVDADARLHKAESSVAVSESETAKRSAERDELKASPSKFIRSLEVTIYDRGIVNNYSRGTSAKFRNTSQFNVSELHGTVEYRGTNDELIGSAPASIGGTLLAGQTATLPLSAGEVTGRSSAAHSRVIIDSLTILGEN